ncbi:carbohydrate-binding domain-containing protein [Emticicia agri]|uniref:Carbohydrate-binding domain-containing protein n=1 Tax=Emticicia agri TaxID=2492393 RepID=A0A4Q5M0N9_9BACT|nr:carbohydrate-binding domain-containing protein [Emticicia agri]RYU95764.1 carbohydrate-binding domain-containing protein [Emticicia agri]
MMKKPQLALLLKTFLLSLIFMACSKNTDPSPTGTDEEESAEVHEAEGDYTWASTDVVPITLNGSSIIVGGTGATVSGTKVTITKAGNYSISGTLSNGQIIVNTEDKTIVRLILNGVDITTSNSSPIYIKKSEKTLIVLAENTQNKLTDGTSYVYDDVAEEEPNATIFSKDDLSFYGSGSLTVNGNFADGIASKDGLIIKSGNITVNAADDGIRGKDYLILKDGNITINSKADGLKSSNDTDTALGYVIIEKGTYTIAAGDDGIHAETKLTIEGGTINITKSYEGLEGKQITINDGTIHLVSSDDGVNVADGTGNEGGFGGMGGGASSSGLNLFINGGYLYLNAGGDGLDANGSITMTGGTVIVDGPTANNNASLDYDGSFKITGGLLIAVGSSGMAQVPGTTSTQNSVLVNFTAAQNAGSLINIQNADGKSIVTYKPAKRYQSIAFSSKELANGTYNVFLGGSSTGAEKDGLYTEGTYTSGTKNTSFTVSGVVTKVNAR